MPSLNALAAFTNSGQRSYIFWIWRAQYTYTYFSLGYSRECWHAHPVDDAVFEGDVHSRHVYIVINKLFMVTRVEQKSSTHILLMPLCLKGNMGNTECCSFGSAYICHIFCKRWNTDSTDSKNLRSKSYLWLGDLIQKAKITLTQLYLELEKKIYFLTYKTISMNLLRLNLRKCKFTFCTTYSATEWQTTARPCGHSTMVKNKKY